MQKKFSNKSGLNNLYIHLTFNCQLNCNHCYANSIQTGSQFIDIDKIEEIVLVARKLNFHKVIFTGGEPLLHPHLLDFLNILTELKTKGSPMQFVLRTNFVKEFSHQVLEKIANSFTKIVVSIDGDSENHNIRRGQGSYEATLKNLSAYQKKFKLDRNTAELWLSSVLSSKESDSFLCDSVRKLAQELGIKQVRFRPILPIGRAINWENQLISEALSSFQDLDEILMNGHPMSNTCGIGQNLYIEPNGDSFPCYAFHKPHTYLGNAIDKGLDAVVSSDNFINLSKATVDTNPKCKLCKYKYLCGGACRSWGGEQTQFDLNSPPPECNGLYQRAEEIYLTALNYLKENKLINNEYSQKEIM